MFAIPDAFAAFYLTCFLLGLVFIIVSALAGLSHDTFHLPGLHHGAVTDAGHVGDVGHAGHVGHVGDVGHAGAGHAGDVAHAGAGGTEGRSAPPANASPLNLMTIMAFLTWFGGAGYILHAILGWFMPFSLIGAVAAGLIAGWLVFLFLVKILLPGSVSIDPREREAVGNLARVTLAIEPGQAGEIVYTMAGARHSDGARAIDGQPISQETEVVIVRYEKGIAFVEPWQQFVSESIVSDPPATASFNEPATEPLARLDAESTLAEPVRSADLARQQPPELARREEPDGDRPVIRSDTS